MEMQFLLLIAMSEGTVPGAEIKPKPPKVLLTGAWQYLQTGLSFFVCSPAEPLSAPTEMLSGLLLQQLHWLLICFGFQYKVTKIRGTAVWGQAFSAVAPQL